MHWIAKKWLVALCCGFLLGFCPGVAWGAQDFDDEEGDSQIYAHYVSGQNNQQQDENSPEDSSENSSEGELNSYEPTPGYNGDNSDPGQDNQNNQNNENNQDNQNNENNQNNQDNQNNQNNGNQNEAEPENNLLTEPSDQDFPDLQDSLEVLLWDEASQTNKKSLVTPVNLALSGRYLPSDVPAMALSGRTLVPVRLISEQLEAAVVWDQESNKVTISLDGKTIVLTIGSSSALVDGQPVQVPGDVSVTLVTYEGTSRTMVPVRFVVESLDAVVSYDPAQRIVNITPPVRQPEEDEWDWQNRPITPGTDYEQEPEPEPEPEVIPPPGIDENGNLLRRVVLDAGHGGTDPGTNGSGYEEKDINLAVTLKLQRVLENAGFEVIMARSDDSYVGLVERAALTVEEDAPVFVSIHCNSAANIPSANGIETYAAPDDPDDAELAGFIQKELIAATGANNRGVKTSALVVLTHNAAPACLVEIGFMSNSAECAKIASSAYQQKLAEAVAAGVQAYFAAKAEQ